MSTKLTKKRKRKSFLQKAKKFGKQGKFGKGRQLPEEDYNFFLRVLQHVKDPDFQEKDIVIRNFLNSLEDNKIKSLVTSQIGSRVLDEVLFFAPVRKVISILQILSQDLRIYCTDPYASHVIQTLLSLSLKYIQQDATFESRNEETNETEKISVSPQEKKMLENSLQKTCKFAYNNLEEFINNIYASHIIRTIFEVCSGVEVSSDLRSSQKSQLDHAIKSDPKEVLKVPRELFNLLENLALRLMQLPNFVDVIQTECGSTVLQTALLVLFSSGNDELSNALVGHIITHGFKRLPPAYSNIHTVLQHNSTTRLLEVVLYVATIEQQQTLWNSYFDGKMHEILTHRLANFVIQKLLTSWKDKSSFKVVYDSVTVNLESVVEIGFSGVVLCLVQACHRLATHQSRCLKTLMMTMKCFHPDDAQLKFASCLLYFLPLPQLESRTTMTTSLHGSLVIQELLKFNKPIKIVNSILEMSSSELQLMACDPKGSHVIDAFVQSSYIGERSRDKFVLKFKGFIANLSCSKHGSRSVEALWGISSVKLKTVICNELLQSEKKLLDNQFGKIIYNNFQVKLFKRNDRSDWQELQDKHKKKKLLLQEFLNDKGIQMDRKADKQCSAEVYYSISAMTLEGSFNCGGMQQSNHWDNNYCSTHFLEV